MPDIIVPGVGPQGAKIALVGEAPGRDEEQAHRPFVGASGRLLDQMLANAGISRESCYVTNVVKTRPPNNDFGVFYVDRQKTIPTPLLSASIQALKEELDLIKPNVVVALGAEPLRALVGHKEITKWRGSILYHDGRKVVPTFHPAYILRVYGDRPVGELDLRKAARESRSPLHTPPRFHFKIDPSFDEVMEFLSRKHTRLALDIETSRSPQLTKCLGLADSPTSALVIPFVRSNRQPRPGSTTIVLEASQPETLMSVWHEDQEYQILEALNRLLLSPSVEFILQNVTFEMTVLAREFGFQFANIHLDTMVAHHCCYPEMPKGLDFLASIYTDIPYWSDYNGNLDRGLWVYNAYDCVATFQCAEKLEKEMQELEVEDYYRTYKHPLALSITSVQSRGLYVNDPLRRERLREAEAERESLTKKLQAITSNPDFNPASPKQVADYLYVKLRLPVQLHHKTKKPTTDKAAIEFLERKYPGYSPFFQAFSAHSKIDTLISSFLSREPDPTGRLWTSLNPVGTVTGRLSSSEPPFDIPGTNLQNIPRGVFRQLFIPPPGYLWAKADLSQAEFRIVAWLANIRKVIERYTNDPSFDVHRWVATLIYNITEEQVTKEQRSNAKNGVYGGNYRMHYVRAASVYHMPLDVAKFILETYRQRIPEIPLWWRRVEAQINSTRTIINPSGHKRIFMGRLDDSTYREAYSHSAQSIVADLTDRALVLSETILAPKGILPVLQVHDELDFYVREDQASSAPLLIKRVMEYPLDFPGVPEPLIIPAEVSLGPNWYEQKKVEVR